MKRTAKPVFFIIAALTLVFTYLAFFGISTTYGDNKTVIIKGGEDIRLGIDIRGGVDVTFTPPEDIIDTVTTEQLEAAQAAIEQRMISIRIQATSVSLSVSLGKRMKRILIRKRPLKSSAQPLCSPSARDMRPMKKVVHPE